MSQELAVQVKCMLGTVLMDDIRRWHHMWSLPLEEGELASLLPSNPEKASGTIPQTTMSLSIHHLMTMWTWRNCLTPSEPQFPPSPKGNTSSIQPLGLLWALVITSIDFTTATGKQILAMLLLMLFVSVKYMTWFCYPRCKNRAIGKQCHYLLSLHYWAQCKSCKFVLLRVLPRSGKQPLSSSEKITLWR